MRYSFGIQDAIDIEGAITVIPSSRTTAEVSPIDVAKTDQLRLRLVPKLVQNHQDGDRCVETKLGFEKKRPSEELFPSERADGEKVSRGSIKAGDWLDLHLSTTDTLALMQSLKKLYDLYAAIGIPSTYTTYVEADVNTASAINLLRRDPSALRMLSQEENYEIIRDVLRLLTQSQSREALQVMLSELEEESIERLSTTLNMEQLERAAAEFEQNITNPHEEYWQSSMFGKYPWILSQIFAAPMVMFAEKAYVGGKSIENKEGNECDFIYRNHMTSNVCLIEIKTPMKKLLGIEYRGTYSLSSELSGAVNQVLNYRDSLQKSYHDLVARSETPYEVFTPRCAVIIGSSTELDSRRKRSAFENFRNSLNGVVVLTYDEVLQRVRELIQIMS